MYNLTGSLEEGLSLQIMYNNTADVTGSYEGILWTDINNIDNLSRLCEGYHNYITFLSPFVPVIFTYSFWVVKREYKE